MPRLPIRSHVVLPWKMLCVDKYGPVAAPLPHLDSRTSALSVLGSSVSRFSGRIEALGGLLAGLKSLGPSSGLSLVLRPVIHGRGVWPSA